ncbi:hypothetical protein CO168_03280, partial [Candidatus Shapirobacteria bacterium CG_4_9_14_3_um_filter_36_12]
MPKYRYKAKDWMGKMVKGELELGTEKSVIESLRASGLIPLGVQIKSENMMAEVWRKISGRINGKMISNFTRQLATMMTAG